MGIHIAYCTRDPAPEPDWDDPDSVPVLREMDGATLARAVAPQGVLPVNFDGVRMNLALPRLAPAILARVDGRRSLGEIAEAVAAGGASREQVARDLAALRGVMEPLNRLLLAAPRPGGG